MHKENGIIALDLDGTLTNNPYRISKNLLKYLKMLSKDWTIAIVTGRTYSLAMDLLKPLKCPYFFSPQNGVELIQMPDKKVIYKNYFPKSYLTALEEIFKSIDNDYILFAGTENEDKTFYRSKLLDPSVRDYLVNHPLKEISGNWIEVNRFHDLNLLEFPMAKVYWEQESLIETKEKILETNLFDCLLVGDSTNKEYSILQITHKGVNKGELVKSLMDFTTSDCIIAAGNDYNDISMIELAKVKMVAEDSPDDLLEKADIVFSPSCEDAILESIEEAIEIAAHE